MSDRLYRTCDTCGITKYFTKFETTSNQKNKKRAVEKRRKPYCKECKRRDWHEQNRLRQIKEIKANGRYFLGRKIF